MAIGMYGSSNYPVSSYETQNTASSCCSPAPESQANDSLMAGLMCMIMMMVMGSAARGGPGKSAGGTQEASQPKMPPSGIPGAPNAAPRPDDEPVDPNMTVQHYVDANNGLLGKLGNQEGVKDKLKERYGDWDDPERTEDERKQSAYNASRHVGMIEHKRSAAGEDRGEFARDGKLDGSTDSGEIREGTEMADLKDSLKGDTLEEQNANTDRILGYGGLNETNDEWVNANGSTRDNSEVHGQRAGEFFEGFGQGFTSVFASLLGIK